MTNRNINILKQNYNIYKLEQTDRIANTSCHNDFLQKNDVSRQKFIYLFSDWLKRSSFKPFKINDFLIGSNNVVFYSFKFARKIELITA